jgi:hypothetical protein
MLYLASMGCLKPGCTRWALAAARSACNGCSFFLYSETEGVEFV